MRWQAVWAATPGRGCSPPRPGRGTAPGSSRRRSTLSQLSGMNSAILRGPSAMNGAVTIAPTSIDHIQAEREEPLAHRMTQRCLVVGFGDRVDERRDGRRARPQRDHESQRHHLAAGALTMSRTVGAMISLTTLREKNRPAVLINCSWIVGSVSGPNIGAM